MNEIRVIAPTAGNYPSLASGEKTPGFGVLLIVDGVHTHLVFNTRSLAESFMEQTPVTNVAHVENRTPDIPPTVTRLRLY